MPTGLSTSNAAPVREMLRTVQSITAPSNSIFPAFKTRCRDAFRLRAAVLGANDGIISTASLIVGVAAAAAAPHDVLIAGIAGLVAGAMSMAAGEYVSVSSQSDTELADLARERRELSENPESELEELTDIYVKRGLEPELARQVSQQLMAKDALKAHAHDELGISEATYRMPRSCSKLSTRGRSASSSYPRRVR